MEGTVLNSSYMNLGYTEDALKEFLNIKAQCKFVEVILHYFGIIVISLQKMIGKFIQI